MTSGSAARAVRGSFQSASSVHGCPEVSSAETLTPSPGIVDLWYHLCEDLDASSLDGLETLISPGECARLKSFRFDRDRVLFLATRVLVRTVLSNYAPVLPSAWHFATDRFGKPRIAFPQLPIPLYFNLANTPGLVACVVSASHQSVGVDAERITPEVDFAGVAANFLSPSEAEALRALPAHQKPARFFTYWTLKESYLKARGVGLTVPLDDFSVLLGDAEIRMAFGPRLADDPDLWRFDLLDLPSHHVIAVAANTSGAPLSLRATRVLKLPRLRAPSP